MLMHLFEINSCIVVLHVSQIILQPYFYGEIFKNLLLLYRLYQIKLEHILESMTLYYFDKNIFF